MWLVMTCIVIVGYQGCGKSEIGECLKRLLNVQIIEIGDIVRELYKEQISEKSVIEFADGLFEKGKELLIEKRALQLIQPDSQGVAFVGLRTRRELRFLKSRLEINLVIGIKCDIWKRYQLRVTQKKESDNFFLRELVEQNWDKGESILDECDIIINNNNNGVTKLVDYLQVLRSDICEK